MASSSLDSVGKKPTYSDSVRLSTSSTVTATAPKVSFRSNSIDIDRREKCDRQGSGSLPSSFDVDKLMRKLEEDDKALRELEKLEVERHNINTTSNMASTVSVSNSSALDIDSSFQVPTTISSLATSQITTATSSIGTTTTAALSSSMPALNDRQSFDRLPQSTSRSRAEGVPSISSKELDKLMRKLEQDNKILAELDQKVKRVSSNNMVSSSNALLSSSLPALTSNLSGLHSTSHTQFLSDRSHVNREKKLTLPINSMLPGKEDPALVLQQIRQQYNKEQELRMAEDIVDSIEIPNRGRCKVFIARYSYDPFKQSPNENPEQELHLAAGDFIMVFSEMDDDGFYMGETLDGRRGLVPSNFIEKLTGEDLFEFQATVLYENRDGDESSVSYPPEFYDAILNDAMAHTNFQHLIAPEDFHRMNDYIELAESQDIDEEDLSDPERAQATAARDMVPPPRRLILERQFHKSVLISWLPPDCPPTFIECYQIYVDGVLKVTIPSIERTKALVEGVDSSIPHRVSIRAINNSGRASKDAACTIILGKTDVPFAPCSVKATNITSESALISWLPCNSNFYHVVAVNSVEVKTVGPGFFKHLITGLAANTLYRVSVRAKPGKLMSSEEKNPKKLEMLTTFVDFRTLPKSLPEPPVDIQVEAGPQDGTLLITWLPVTLDQYGTSNGCPVTGYAVFAAHKKLTEIDSPTGDHALLDVGQIESFHKKSVTVRTKSGENLSQDSMPCQIPDDLIKLSAHRKVHPGHPSLKAPRRTQPSMRHHPSQHHYPLPPHQQPYASHHPDQHLQHSYHQHPHQMHSQPLQQHGNRHGGVMSMQHQFHPQNQYPMQMQQQGFQSNSGPMQPNPNRMAIPSIAITKDTPSESVNPIESYSEEEFEATMKGRGGRYGGPSPQPPHRSRQYSEYERSHFGSGRIRGPRDIRWFVALYDYDPLTMSPNPDAANEELPFREGDLIKIYGDKDPDGFYRGELNGRIGYVPCNMVSEVQCDPETGQPLRGTNDNDPWGHLPVKKMVALYDYDPQELSPNPDTEVELAFNAGDVIYVYGEMDEDGFYMGELSGVRGLVPSNFLTESTDRHGQMRGRPGMQGYQQQYQQGHMGQPYGSAQGSNMYGSNMYQNSGMMPGQGIRPQGQYNNQNMGMQQQSQLGMMGNKHRPNSLDLGMNQQMMGQQQVGQQQITNQQMQQQPTQQTSLNPFSSLFASGKKILEEATTPRGGQQNNFGAFGQQPVQQQQQQMPQQMPSQQTYQQQQHQQQQQQQQQHQQQQQQQHQNQQLMQQIQQHTQQQFKQGPRFGTIQTQQPQPQQQQQYGQGFYGGPTNQMNQMNQMGQMGQMQQQNQAQQQGPTLSGALGAVKSIFKI